MTKTPSFFTKRPSTPILIIGGGALLSLALIAWIFAPGGFLDSLTRPLDIEASVQGPLEPHGGDLPEALSLEKNAAFLADNAKKPGVKTTASGLQYKVVKAGEGKQPGPTSTVTVHYVGTMIDGTEFDSSVGRGEPASFALDGVIGGWTEGLQLMREGEKVEFVIPQDLAYGPEGKGSIPPNQTLVFQVELIKVH